MRDQLTSDDRILLLELFGMAHTIRLRLDDLGDQLLLNSDVSEGIQHTARQAHSLIALLSNHLID